MKAKTKLKIAQLKADVEAGQAGIAKRNVQIARQQAEIRQQKLTLQAVGVMVSEYIGESRVY